MILSCVGLVHYNLLVNGGWSGEFLLSMAFITILPNLYVVSSAMLAHLIVRDEMMRNLQGIKFCREVEAISHFLYMDHMSFNL